MTESSLTEQAHALLCPALCRILDAELAAGNAVSDVWSSWGEVVLLVQPFLLEHAESESVRFHWVNDPHYWKAEYRCGTARQTLGCRF